MPGMASLSFKKTLNAKAGLHPLLPPPLSSTKAMIIDQGHDPSGSVSSKSPHSNTHNRRAHRMSLFRRLAAGLSCRRDKIEFYFVRETELIKSAMDRPKFLI